MYIPANFALANFMYKKFGVKATICIGVILNCICLGCRTLINFSFVLAMAGGIFSGIAQPLILNADAEIAANWFGTNEVNTLNL